MRNVIVEKICAVTYDGVFRQHIDSIQSTSPWYQQNKPTQLKNTVSATLALSMDNNF